MITTSRPLIIRYIGPASPTPRKRNTMNEKPDNFWPWRTLDIDEDAWDHYHRPEPGPSRIGWFLIGAIIGLLFVVAL